MDIQLATCVIIEQFMGKCLSEMVLDSAKAQNRFPIQRGWGAEIE